MINYDNLNSNNGIQLFDETRGEKQCITKIIIMGVEIGFMKTTPISGGYAATQGTQGLVLEFA